MYSSWRCGRLVVVKIKRMQDPRGRAYLTGLDAYRGLLHHRLRSGAKLKWPQDHNKPLASSLAGENTLDVQEAQRGQQESKRKA